MVFGILLNLVIPLLSQGHTNQHGNINLVTTEHPYICPPCGCGNDGTSYSQKGVCTVCNMTLIPKKQGFLGEINDVWAANYPYSTFTDIYDIIAYPTFFQGLILAFILFFRRENQVANTFLIMMMLAISFYIIRYSPCKFGLTSGNQWLFLPVSFITLIGPSIFLYTKSLTTVNYQFGRKELLHFTVPLIFFLMYIGLFALPAEMKYQMKHSSFQAYLDFSEQILSVLLALIYILLSFGILKYYRNWAIENISDNLNLHLGWLKKLLTSLAVIFGIWLVILTFQMLVYKYSSNTLIYHPVMIGLSLIVFGIGYAGILQPAIFNKINLPVKQNGYSGLSASKADTIVNRLRSLMEQEQLYLDSALSLHTLANRLDVNPKTLSHILNNTMNSNFYDFINQYRIEEVKNRLVDPTWRHLTNLAIAFDCGFNSKSSFNSLFKKYTGQTPKEYKKDHHRSLEIRLNPQLG